MGGVRRSHTEDIYISEAESIDHESAVNAYAGMADQARLPKRRRRLDRKVMVWSALAALCFGAGFETSAIVDHLSHSSRTAGVVIEPPAPQAKTSTPSSLHTSPPTDQSGLSWGPALLVDSSAGLDAVSCPADNLCMAVDADGHEVNYTARGWAAPVRIDNANQITSVSCPTANFCLAVDDHGNSITYNGKTWSTPEPIDKTAFNDLTSVSCSSPTFCAAVDGGGNGLTYTGGRWSPPIQIDPEAWTTDSRDVAAISCPTDGFCVGVDNDGNAFFYTAGTWQDATSIPSSNPSSNLKYDNAISCSSPTFCAASQNLGQLLTYNGTQWSLPVAADPSNYLASVSCISPGFCTAIDGLLPSGFNDDGGTGNGQLLTYDGIEWSSPQPADAAGVVTAVSCSSTTFCVVVDASGHAVIGQPPPSLATPHDSGHLGKSAS